MLQKIVDSSSSLTTQQSIVAKVENKERKIVAIDSSYLKKQEVRAGGKEIEQFFQFFIFLALALACMILAATIFAIFAACTAVGIATGSLEAVILTFEVCIGLAVLTGIVGYECFLKK